MALERHNRVRDQTTTTGTGTFTIAGTAPTGYRTVAEKFTDGATVRYTAFTQDLTEWEVGEGIWTASGATLTRATIYDSSNAGAAVDFSAGTKFLLCSPVAADIAMLVADGQIAFPATQNPSAGANTLDDYEEKADATLALTFVTPGNLDVVYDRNEVLSVKIGSIVFLHFRIRTSTFTHTSASGDLLITGFPETAHAGTAGTIFFVGGALSWTGITKAGYTDAAIRISQGASNARIDMSGSGQAISTVTAADMPTGSTVELRGLLIYRTTG